MFVNHADATAPAAVQNIQAKYEDGNILLQWDAVPEANHYRIYFSNRSILENAGEYDDFEETDGAVTEHALTYKPSSSKVFFAILAVNSNEEESPFFLEETFVLLSNSGISVDDVGLKEIDVSSLSSRSSQSSTAAIFNVTGPNVNSSSPADINIGEVPLWQQADNGGTFHLLLAESLNQNEVLLRFSDIPYIEPESAPQAFSIVDSDGKELRIQSILLYEDTITVRTEIQKKNEVYQVRLSEPLMSAVGAPLDAIDRKILFRGHTNGNEDAPLQASSSSQFEDDTNVLPNIPEYSAQICTPELSMPMSVRNLHLNAIAQSDGTFTVQIRWTPDTGTCQTPVNYIVRQSIDGGRSYTNPEPISVEIGGIDVPGVYSQKYAIGISVQDSTGAVSKEALDMIELPIQVQSNSSAPNQISSTPSYSSNNVPTQINHPLTQSGMGGIAALLIMIAGIGGGVWSTKKMKNAK